jgi:hypothetical protein
MLMTFTDAVTIVTSLVTIVAAIAGVVTYIYSQNQKKQLDRKHITLVSVASLIGVVLVIIVAREIASLPINQNPGKQPPNNSFSGSTPTQGQNTTTANATPTSQTNAATGRLWHSQNSRTSQTLNAVAWSRTQFVAVGANGTILTSRDGSTWTPQKSGTSQTLNAVVWADTQFVAVGANGTILTSP